MQRHEAAVAIAFHCEQLEWDHPISQMIRNGENDEALDLLEGIDLLENEDYREPTKGDFLGWLYRVSPFDAATVLDIDGNRAYKTQDTVWAVERWSPKYGWNLVTQQYLPYCYEPVHFLSEDDAIAYKARLEDPHSDTFDGMRAYEGQDIRRFKPDFFPKD